ncbi:MAG TPA: HNH endonuclease signature motif containing protein [Methanoregulaceae archaeon]|nr:HNH endonuclease signature motif containing protein [Methanoregulaceae archaeon]
MEKRLKWHPYKVELQYLSDDLIDRRETYDAIGKRLELIFGPAGKILGVDARLLAFLEFLYSKSQGPYSPYFLKYSRLIKIIIRRSAPLRNMLNESGAHAIGNMVLNGRGKLKFKISDFNELSYVLDFWENCGLLPQTPRTIFNAIKNKSAFRYRIEKLDGALLIRLSNIFPMFETEIIPSDVDIKQLIESQQEPFREYYQEILQDYLSQGKGIDEIIDIENQRAGKTLVYRNQFLSFLVKKRHDFHCQICAAGDPAIIPSSIQVHHIMPLSEKGEDHSSNMIVTCNYHHQEIHNGKIKIEIGNIITIHINGKKYFTTPN